MNKAAASLYQKEAKIYPKHVRGRYTRLRHLTMLALLGLYYLGPWLRWDGRQALLFDLPARKFYIFGITLFPQDFIFLALLLVIAGLSLFFFTALAGRLWCGYACPQTVWTEAFLLLERWVEGDRNRRIKLDKKPWNGEKLLKKSTKQFLWLSFALFTGFTFVGYFTPITELFDKLIHFQAGPWETFWTLFYSLATYGNAGFLREQVCKYMCPYARFQSAMFDKDTLVISYDDGRGEPRGGRSKKADPNELGLGDCIDCTLCVQVCPTGIDIRNGLQYECIACAACVDVCDQVMDKMGYPRGLVRYTTEHAFAGGKTRILRPRILVYAAVLLALVSILGFSLLERVPLRADLLRDRNALYRVVNQTVENVYTLRLTNMDVEPHAYSLSISPDSPFSQVELVLPEALQLEAESAGGFSVIIKAARDAGAGGRDIMLDLRAQDDPGISAEIASRFYLPLE